MAVFHTFVLDDFFISVVNRESKIVPTGDKGPGRWPGAVDFDQPAGVDTASPTPSSPVILEWAILIQSHGLFHPPIVVARLRLVMMVEKTTSQFIESERG